VTSRVPSIELVDGDRLLDMLETLQLDLTPVQTYELDATFFEQFER
jgi:restriction system protein